MIDDVQSFTKIAEARTIPELGNEIRRRLNDDNLGVFTNKKTGKISVYYKNEFNITDPEKSLRKDIVVSIGSRRDGKLYIAKMRVK